MTIVFPKIKPEDKAGLSGNKKEFVVYPTTAGACVKLMSGHVVAGHMLHCLLDIWLNAKTKIVRKYKGKDTEFLSFSHEDLQELSGMSEAQVRNNALPALKTECPYLLFLRRRNSPSGFNRVWVHFSITDFWKAICLELGVPKKKVKENVGGGPKYDGFEVVKEEVDRNKLAPLFRRLYDDIQRKYPVTYS